MKKCILQRNRTTRRRGIAMVYFALTLTVTVGMVGMVLDLGRLYVARAEAQRAADAAALAGAPFVLDFPDGSRSKEEALKLAAVNGFNLTNPKYKADVISKVNPDGAHPHWHRVTVRRTEPLYFMPILGFNIGRIGATATAALTTYAGLPIGPNDAYGVSDGPVNLSVFGPYARYTYGDAYSPRYLDDGTTNTLHTGKGYDFDVVVNKNYTDSKLQIQVFDPDCYNNGGDDAVRNLRLDEIREPSDEVRAKPDYGSNLTTTKYTLYSMNPNGSVAAVIASASYGGTDSSTDMKWVTPGGFEVDMSSGLFPADGSGTRRFRVNVTTTDGASENGFNLRAGKPGETNYVGNNTSINAVGRLPVNFVDGGDTVLNLANVAAPPASFTGTPEIQISKFDTDIESVSVDFKVDPGTSERPDGMYSGVLSGNGKWVTDTITLPKDYKGGNWTARYTAGRQDTSVWEVRSTFHSSTGVINLVL